MVEGDPLDPRRLVADGWQRQNVASEPRLSEAVEMYRSLGYEVVLVPAARECAAEGDDGSCRACFRGDEDPSRYQVIYTRPRAVAEDGAGNPSP